MINPTKMATRWTASLVMAAACSLALTACEGASSPNSEPAAAAPAQAPADLMGAPSTRSTPYTPPATDADATPPGAPPAYAPPAPPPGLANAGPPPYAYPSRASSSVPAEVIAMAPIPNPPEEPRHTHHWRPYHHMRHRHGWWGPVYAAHGPVRRHHLRARVHAHPLPHRQTALLRPHHAVKPAHIAAATAATAAGAQLLKPKVPHTPKPDAAAVSAASGGLSNTTAAAVSPPVAPAAGARYDALTTALSTVFAHEATLEVPASNGAQPMDVTLTVPGDFAQTVATEAGKLDMLDEAASANLGANLIGDGYTIVPIESQAQALTVGAPTVFHWKVTPQGATQGPLHADARLTLLASGRSLALGSVKVGGAPKLGRLVGVGLLVLIAAALIAWVLRSRRRPAPTGAIRPRPNANPPGF